jgi:hypothetical protein
VTTNASQLLTDALARHYLGDLAGAERLARQVLAAPQSGPDAAQRALTAQSLLGSLRRGYGRSSTPRGELLRALAIG